MRLARPTAAPPTVGGNLLALLSAVLWASSFPATEYLLRSWDPLLLCLARLAGASLFFGLLFLLVGRPREPRRVPWRDVAFLGAFGVAAPVFLLIAGQSRSDAVTVAIISTTLPLISAVMGWLLDGERPGPLVVLGILLAFLGGSLASLAGAAAAEAAGPRGGEVLVLGSMILWIWYSRAALARLRAHSDLALSGLTFGAGTLVVAPLVGLAVPLGLAAPRFDFGAPTLAVLAWMSMIAIGLSVLLWFTCARLLGVTVAAIHTNLAPFYVMLIALAFGGSVAGQQVAGAALVVAGALLAQLTAPPRRPPSPERP